MSRHSLRKPQAAAFGQHLLRDSAVAERIITSTGLAPPSLVFDLGAGNGVLTAAVARKGCRAVAVELDRALWRNLKHRFQHEPLVDVVLGDLLQVELPRRARYTVISNVPFALTARLMRRLQQLPNPPADTWLVLQEEAAHKWCGLGHETLASLLLKLRFEVDVVLALRRRDFAPRPAVNSVVVHLRLRPRPVLVGPDARRFEALVRRAFTGPESVHAREISFDDWIVGFRAQLDRRPGATRHRPRPAAATTLAPGFSPGSRRPSPRAARRE